MDERCLWLWFLRLFGVGNNRIWEFLRDFEDIDDAYAAVSEGRAGLKLTESERNSARNLKLSSVQSVADICDKRGYDIITYSDSRYPQRLRDIYNPPAVIFCMGDISEIDEYFAITVVGTRRPSEYSLRVAEKLCTDLARIGTVLISGFALGIDSKAHAAALENGTKTIAVLGCGLDVDYPKGNSKFKRIIAANGAVVTEFFPGTSPRPENFPQRNRILSALSNGTLVIEAGPHSGSLITADHALSQGKEVFCVPPADLFDERYSGVIKYLRDGAIPVFSYHDIVYEYYENFSHKISNVNPYGTITSEKNSSALFGGGEKPRSPLKRIRTPIEPVPVTVSEEHSPPSPEEFDGTQRRIIELLQGGEMLLDEIISGTGLDAGDIMTEITELELIGAVISLPGKRYMLG